MKLKVCGMKYNPAEVAALNPDYLGFIFWEPSPRHFDGPAPEWEEDGPVRAGVFVDAQIGEVLEKTRDFSLGMLQLHGSESPEYCRELQSRLRGAGLDAASLVKAFAVGPDFDFGKLAAYQPVCDAFLFDSRGPLPGGNGKVFDWSLLEDYGLETPFFLSGGIGPESIQALEHFLSMPVSQRCIALDINSGFETAPGQKDITLITEFMNEAFWQNAKGEKHEKR
ncbi:phosphoribosylanthranilate isomerase [Robiginitalea sediminis]|uniref:phosphoribosylanthranilate isomerase n=1 Tax=Robiginitalea sediminis TaxID=1982593 RepID=UPI000B4AAF09|nr:phosphoribosylanthranilate isomerase [Robiginitalea sediminis]